MQPSQLELLNHILEEAGYLIERSRGLTRETFGEDPTLVRAFIRSIEVIGEASQKLPETLKDKHPRIQWRSIGGMRNRLIHGYFSVDLDIVWDVVRNKIPILHAEISSIIAGTAEK